MLNEVLNVGKKYGVTLTPSVETPPGAQSRVLIFRAGECFLADLESLVRDGGLEEKGFQFDRNANEFWATICYLDPDDIDDLVDEVEEIKLPGYVARKESNWGCIVLEGDEFFKSIRPEVVDDDWKKILMGEDPIRDEWWDGFEPLPTPQELGLED